MPASTVWLKVEGEQTLQEVLGTLETAEGELVLDFSSVARVDANALRMLEALAGKADSKSVKVVLGGVNLDVYKTLKLTKLAGRFGYLS